jgi:hypothetical protein
MSEDILSYIIPKVQESISLPELPHTALGRIAVLAECHGALSGDYAPPIDIGQEDGHPGPATGLRQLLLEVPDKAFEPPVEHFFYPSANRPFLTNPGSNCRRAFKKCLGSVAFSGTGDKRWLASLSRQERISREK